MILISCSWKKNYATELQIRRRRAKQSPITASPRNQEPVTPLAYIRQCLYRNQLITADGFTDLELRNGFFLRVNSIIRDSTTGQTILRGWRFCSVLKKAGLERHRHNELFLRLEVDREDDRPPSIQGQVDVRLSSVRRRVKIVLPNKPDGALEDHNFPSDALLCRFKLTLVADTATLRVRGSYPERVFQLLDEDECDSGHGQSKKQLRAARGTRAFGLGFGRVNQTESEDYRPPDSFWANTRRRSFSPKPGWSTYTFGDGFCGAGGVSIGARLAGLEVRFAFDHDPFMCSTYNENFPDTPVAMAEAANIVDQKQYHVHLDILHLSPPCQPWSKAHNYEGRNSEKNREALYKTSALVRALQPRIYTLEQTISIEER